MSASTTDIENSLAAFGCLFYEEIIKCFFVRDYDVYIISVFQNNSTKWQKWIPLVTNSLENSWILSRSRTSIFTWETN